MNELTPISINTKVPENWDYDSSVSKIKQKIYKWNNLSAEILEELWIAREKLSKDGNPHRDLTGKKFPVKTWNDYCEEIGVVRRTVNTWLDRYKPQAPKINEKVISGPIETKHSCPKCGYQWN